MTLSIRDFGHAVDRRISMTSSRPLLEIEDLWITSETRPDWPILRGISLSVERNETLAIVGESGCGKSVTSLSVMGLLPSGLRVAGGSVRFEGAPLPISDNEAMRKIRGFRIGMVFQDPMAALNPCYTIGDQVAEVITEHEDVSSAQALERVVQLLGQVQLPNPQRIVNEYPHRLSGGQRQRAVIAMALACKPDLIIADEPTTALDVTVQAQIMKLLEQLQRDLGIAIILITHNLGLVAQVADRVAVMYAGHKVEEAETRTLFARPLHPYTEGLLAATPRPGRRRPGEPPLTDIPGLVPSVADRLPGCRFEPRCRAAQDICQQKAPELRRVGEGSVACHFPRNVEAIAP